MALPPDTLGLRVHRISVAFAERAWRATVDGLTVDGTFVSESDARAAAVDRALRLDALAAALVRRLRRRFHRKM